MELKLENTMDWKLSFFTLTPLEGSLEKYFGPKNYILDILF